MEKLFRIAHGTSHDPEVDGWFDARPDELGHIARCWFGELRAAGGDVLELIHEGYPVACVEDAPFGYVNAFSAHVNLGFFRGAFLPDPGGILQGTGKRMRQVKVRPFVAYEGAYDPDALRKLIRGVHTST